MRLKVLKLSPMLGIVIYFLDIIVVICGSVED